VADQTMMMWTCAQAGCTQGYFIMDAQGTANHQADVGHAPVAGRPMGWIFDRSGLLPDIWSLSPATGPSTGATAFTITGSGLTGATGVKIGTVAATAVTVVNDKTITATSPAGTANSTQDVQVTTPHGTGVLPGGWKYGA
jgi:hypothetical protein